MRGFQNREDPISIEKWPISFQKTQAPRILGVRSMWIYQNGAQVSYFLKVSKHFEKINFRTFFFGLDRLKNLFSRIHVPTRNSRKIREKSQIGPGMADKWWKPSQTYFLEFRRSLRSKWVIYQPRTTIFEEVMFLWS